MSETLKRRIRTRRAKVGILGLGYVGLPLVVEFVRAGFDVTGFDVVASKVDALNRGRSYIPDVPSSAVRSALKRKRFRATSNFDLLAGMDAVSMCVPTPLSKTRDPDMSFVESASREVAARLHRDMIVVLESTTYPGTTREVLAPRFQAKGVVVGRDVFLAFSPERIDPGCWRRGGSGSGRTSSSRSRRSAWTRGTRSTASGTRRRSSAGSPRPARRWPPSSTGAPWTA